MIESLLAKIKRSINHKIRILSIASRSKSTVDAQREIHAPCQSVPPSLSPPCSSYDKLIVGIAYVAVNKRPVICPCSAYAERGAKKTGRWTR